MQEKEIVVAITGASGAIYGITLLNILRNLGYVTHLIISKAAAITITYETGKSISEVRKLANFNYKFDDIAACVSSGSKKTKGMIIAPCSVKTMSEIANSISSNLISRVADVTLKEGRKLLLMLRETPLNVNHLRNALNLSKMGVVVFPPVPAFYAKPKDINDLVTYSVVRALDVFGIENDLINRWQGIKK